MCVCILLFCAFALTLDVGNALYEKLAAHDAALYTMHEVINDIFVYTKNCSACGSVYYPHPVEQGSRVVVIWLTKD